MSSQILVKLTSELNATASRLNSIAKQLSTTGPTKIEGSPRRVRILFNKEWIVDTISSKLVWEHPYFPTYYVPSTDVQTKYIEKVQKTEDGNGYICRLVVGERGAGSVLWFEKDVLDGLLRFEFREMDSWFEEDTEIYVHPKDPYKRIDIIPSSRHVVVKVDDTVVAETYSPLLLCETGLPVRYYLPKTSCNFELLEPSNTVTSCPYKGDANYYSIVIEGKMYRDYIWWYRYPTPESIAIAGKVCFYNEKVDIYLDGVKQERPKSKFG